MYNGSALRKNKSHMLLLSIATIREKIAHVKHLCRRTIRIAVENQHAHTFLSRHILPLKHRFSPRVRPFTIRLSWPHSSVIRLAFQDIFSSFYDNSPVMQKPLTAYQNQLCPSAKKPNTTYCPKRWSKSSNKILASFLLFGENWRRDFHGLILLLGPFCGKSRNQLH